MPANKVDGIKKISKEELERSRNIVLDTIGESNKKEKTPKESDYLINKNTSRRVDGLNVSTKPKKDKKVSLESKKSLLSMVNKPKKETGKGAVTTENEQKNIANTDITSESKENIKKSPGLIEKTVAVFRAKINERQTKHEIKEKRKEELRKLKEEERKKLKEKRMLADENRKKQEHEKKERIAKQQKAKISEKESKEKDQKKIKPDTPAPVKKKHLKELISAAGYNTIEKKGVDFVAGFKEEPKKKKTRETEKLSKEKILAERKEEKLKKEEDKRKKVMEDKIKREEEKKRKEEAKQKSKEEREKKKKERKEKIKELIHVLNRRLLSISKRSIHITVIIFVTGMVIYFVALISIVQFDIDNKLTRQFASHVPIPAYISTDGIIEYFKYKDIRNSSEYSDYSDSEKEETIKLMLVKTLVLEKLVNKYNLLVNKEDGIIPQLEHQLAFDMDVNLVPVNRIKKIKQLIDKQDDFVRIATKYGDELGQITMNVHDADSYEYYDEVKNLELGEVSDTIFTTKGYYIFKCFDKDSKSIALSYVFIASNTLEDYISEEARGYRLISFVD